ncbi:MAG: hypothetical protein ACF8NJ_00655 [Phycisphaerales bacterium JB038]
MKITVLASIGGLALVAAHANAGWIGLDDFSGNETLIDFNTTDMGTLGNPADIGFGVTVLNQGGGTGGDGWRGNTDWGSYFSNIAGASLGYALADSWGASNLTYNLPAGTYRFGLLLSTGVTTTWDLTFYDAAGNVIDAGQATMPGDAQAVFVGYESMGAAIASVNISDVENGYITLMDDVRFEVPAPGTFALFGLAGLACHRRR